MVPFFTRVHEYYSLAFLASRLPPSLINTVYSRLSEI